MRIYGSESGGGFDSLNLKGRNEGGGEDVKREETREELCTGTEPKGGLESLKSQRIKGSEGEWDTTEGVEVIPALKVIEGELVEVTGDVKSVAVFAEVIPSWGRPVGMSGNFLALR